MGLMDKFKNLFTDEEVVEDEEVEIKEIKKEEKGKLPTFMREKIEKEEQEKEALKVEDEGIKKELKLENITEEVPIQDNNFEEKKPFKFPIDFTDTDLMETRISRQAMHSKNKEEIERPKIEKETKREKKIQQKKELKVSEIYKDKKEDPKKDSRRFKATPIISPIYGVIDKNYDPEDIENNRGHNLADSRPSKNVDFDSVRKKAYGSLTDEIKENLMCENCEYLKEAKECKRKHYQEVEEEYYDEDEREYDNITLDEATENYYDYGVEYEKHTPTHYNLEPEQEEDYYLEDEEDIKITNHLDETVPPKKNEIPPVKSSINLLSTLKKSMGDEKQEPKKEKNLELTDDLFNLIDSMYDERNDNK